MLISVFKVFRNLITASILFPWICSSQVSNSSLSCNPHPSSSYVVSFDLTHCFLQTIEDNQNAPNPDLGKTAEEIFTAYSYNYANYNVTSSDGYISTIYRIHGSLESLVGKGKPSVLIVHGGGGSSKGWIVHYHTKNLPFKLVNAGYDVWLLNVRGSSLSNGHVKFDAKKDSDYWDFTYDDVARIDIPIVIDLILGESGNKQLYYICQSIGCGYYLMALAHMPELNAKIKAGALLAPGCGFEPHASGWLRFLVNYFDRSFESLAFWLTGGKLSAFSSNGLGISPASICKVPLLKCALCNNVLSFIYGFNVAQVNYTNLPNIFDKLMDTLPIRMILQSVQNIQDCKFQMYDYGPEKNLMKYGQVEPLEYNLTRVTAPTYIFYGDGDSQTSPGDMDYLKRSLPHDTLRGYFKVDWPLFNHVDFLIAKDADILVYNKILSIFNKHEALA